WGDGAEVRPGPGTGGTVALSGRLHGLHPEARGRQLGPRDPGGAPHSARAEQPGDGPLDRRTPRRGGGHRQRGRAEGACRGGGGPYRSTVGRGTRLEADLPSSPLSTWTGGDCTRRLEIPLLA